jgi:FkbM family methyltransferase
MRSLAVKALLKRFENAVKSTLAPYPAAYDLAKRIKYESECVILPFARAYVRYFPIRTGKHFLFSNVIQHYLGKRSYPSVVKTRSGARMECTLPDLLQSRIYFFGVWEPQITSFMRQRLSPGDTFIDVGANVGYYTLLAASIVGAYGKVCAIEASPSIFKRLQRNVSLNPFHNIELLNVAASDRIGILKIYLGPQDNTGLTTTDASEAARRGNQLEAQVRSRPLHALVDTKTLLRVRLIKIDVEGAELSVIRGIDCLLPRFSDQTEWVFEVTPDALKRQGSSVNELLKFFRDAGYRLYVISNDYSNHDYVSPPRTYQLTELNGLPEKLVDIVASKQIRSVA